MLNNIGYGLGKIIGKTAYITYSLSKNVIGSTVRGFGSEFQSTKQVTPNEPVVEQPTEVQAEFDFGKEHNNGRV